MYSFHVLDTGTGCEFTLLNMTEYRLAVKQLFMSSRVVEHECTLGPLRAVPLRDSWSGSLHFPQPQHSALVLVSGTRFWYSLRVLAEALLQTIGQCGGILDGS